VRAPTDRKNRFSENMNLLQNLKEKIDNLFGKDKPATGKEKFDIRKFLELVSEFEVKDKGRIIL
jgi:hypothetical protein